MSDKVLTIAPKDVVSGQHLVHIDEVNLKKMADDPEYRSRNLALMQREFAGQQGYRFRDSRGTVNSVLTGTVFSLSEENELVDCSRYHGMAQGHTQIDASTSSQGGSKGKSVMEAVSERQAELRERAKAKRTKEKREAERKARAEEREARLESTVKKRAIDSPTQIDVEPPAGEASASSPHRAAEPRSEAAGIDCLA